MFDNAMTATTPDGCDLAVYDLGGAGEPVVLVHGITERAEAWQPVAEQLVQSNRVVALDLRGHGASADAATYDLAAMAGDVITAIGATGLENPHLLGHSLGGIVVSAVGAVYPVTSVINVDQALALGSFQEMLAPAEGMLRDPDTFPAVIAQLFGDLAGPLGDAERARMDALRRPSQDVVLGVWELILTSPLAEIEETVDAALAPYAENGVPYLSLFGVDPGTGTDDYVDWLSARIPQATVEVWDDHGHYPHLVDPERFLERVRTFWAEAARS
ncbi:MAG: alpha/beta hydrolase [Actinomycetota bacterium]